MSDELKNTYKEIRPNIYWDILKAGAVQIKEWVWLGMFGYSITLIWQWLYNLPVTLQAMLVLGLFWTIIALVFGIVRHFWTSRTRTKVLNEKGQTNELLNLESNKDDLISKAEYQTILDDLNLENKEQIKTRQIEYDNLEAKCQAQVNSVVEAQNEITSLNGKHQKKIENINANNLANFKSQEKEHKEIISAWQADEKKLKAELKNHSWLITRAQKQAENIDKCVELKKFYYSYTATDTVPKLIMIAEIYNCSLWDVELNDEIDGYMEFDNHIFQQKMNIGWHSSCEINSCMSKRVVIEQLISKEEKEFIEKFETDISVEKGFKIHNLILTIKGVGEYSPIIPKPLQIRNGFRVINDKDYEKALEKFSQ